MRTNPDGTPLSAETVAEIIADRLEGAAYPSFNDILGDDWSWTFHQTPEGYRSAALAAARRIYNDYAGHLEE